MLERIRAIYSQSNIPFLAPISANLEPSPTSKEKSDTGSAVQPYLTFIDVWLDEVILTIDTNNEYSIKRLKCSTSSENVLSVWVEKENNGSITSISSLFSLCPPLCFADLSFVPCVDLENSDSITSIAKLGYDLKKGFTFPLSYSLENVLKRYFF
jgi:hypothetical protein